MVKICELVGKKAVGAINFNDFKPGIGLSKVKNYLKKHFDLNIDAHSKWQEIADIKDLRNMIAHNNGRFEMRDTSAAERLEKYIEASEWISLSDSKHIVIDRKYFSHVDKSLRTFIKELFCELEARQIL